jgi:hypothetical protein
MCIKDLINKPRWKNCKDLSNGAPEIKLWIRTKKTHFPVFAKNFRRPWMKLKIFFCQFPNPWTLRVSGMGVYTSKCEKKSKSLHPTAQSVSFCIPVSTSARAVLYSWFHFSQSCPAFLIPLQSELSCIPDSTLVRAVLHSWFHFSQSCPAFLIPLWSELSCISDSTSVRAVLHSWFHFSQSCPAFLFPLQSELSYIPDSTSVRAVLHSWFHFSQSCPAFLIPLQSELSCTFLFPLQPALSCIYDYCKL